MVLNRITFAEVSYFMDKIAGHCNMLISTVLSKRSDIILAISAINRNKVARFGGPSEELLITVLAISADLLLPLIQKLHESTVFSRE